MVRDAESDSSRKQRRISHGGHGPVVCFGRDDTSALSCRGKEEKAKSEGRKAGAGRGKYGKRDIKRSRISRKAAGPTDDGTSQAAEKKARGNTNCYQQYRWASEKVFDIDLIFVELHQATTDGAAWLAGFLFSEGTF